MVELARDAKGGATVYEQQPVPFPGRTAKAVGVSSELHRVKDMKWAPYHHGTFPGQQD
jgi:hypothetical protein